MHVLVTGGSGQLGQALANAAHAPGETFAFPPRAELDLGNSDSIQAYMAERPFNAVINGGAYTAVDRAESDALAAWQANCLGPATLADLCRERGIPLIHVSTDYVFDGETAGPVLPTAPIAPLGIYGASKAGGELAVAASGARHAILRTAWVVSPYGNNFVKTMLRLARTRDDLGVVADQTGSPTSADDLAVAVLAITRRFVAERAQMSGIWHIANNGSATWHDVACHAIASAQFDTPPTVRPITTAEYPTPARRPRNSQLDCCALTRDFGITMPPWQDAVARIVADLGAAQGEY